MEIKYQVFVSSTYKDLTEERQEVIQALLELDCIPVGMELFPATDDDQWTLIKRLIDDCDYYILIVGGRYGSISASGVSYTQMEYEYAVSKEIPVISFLNKHPEKIAVGKSESEKEFKIKLDGFKVLVQQKVCRYYESPVELGSVVSRSLIRLIKDKPQPGWVKATFLPSEDTTKEILELTKQVEQLTKELNKVETKGLEATEDLSQGEDEVTIGYKFRTGNIRDGHKSYAATLKLSWNEIFSEISPLMIDESNETQIREKINGLIRTEKYDVLTKQFISKNEIPKEFAINDNDFQTLKIQFRALNLITKSIKKRGVHDNGKYWSLTKHGDTVMTRLRAIKKGEE
jgi:hypothetical protein